MGKRKAFEAALSSDFRWPKKGDTPFAASPDRDRNTTVESSQFLRPHQIKAGYLHAANSLVQQTQEHPKKRETLVFPIIFSYRQYIELSLKYLIDDFGAMVGVNANWTTHDLARLWHMLENILEEYGTSDPDKADQVVRKIIAQFAKVDPQSYSYRYPVDTRGQEIPTAIEELDLEVLADVMKGVESYFNGCQDYLDHLVSSAQGA